MGEAAEEDDASDGPTNWPVTMPMSVALTNTRAARMVDRMRRAAVRAGSLEAMPLFKTAWRCRHVCGFRYADDMFWLAASRVYCVS